jgi:hypothetical protein
MTNRAIGNALKRLNLLRKQCTTDSIGGRYPDWGYSVPDGAALKERILKANGVKDYVENKGEKDVGDEHVKTYLLS